MSENPFKNIERDGDKFVLTLLHYVGPINESFIHPLMFLITKKYYKDVLEKRGWNFYGFTSGSSIPYSHGLNVDMSGIYTAGWINEKEGKIFLSESGKEYVEEKILPKLSNDEKNLLKEIGEKARELYLISLSHPEKFKNEVCELEKKENLS